MYVVCVFVVQLKCNRLKNVKHLFPGRGLNQDLLRGSQTLYRVAIRAGLYRKAVQVYIIPNITTKAKDYLPKPFTLG